MLTTVTLTREYPSFSHSSSLVCRNNNENINTAAYLAKKTLEKLIESTDSEDDSKERT